MGYHEASMSLLQLVEYVRRNPELAHAARAELAIAMLEIDAILVGRCEAHRRGLSVPYALRCGAVTMPGGGMRLTNPGDLHCDSLGNIREGNRLARIGVATCEVGS